MRRSSRLALRWLLVAAALPLIAAPAGVALTDHLEARRSFCNACHLPDGSPLHATKMRLALQQPGLDLTGVHFQRADHGRFTCADCHRGQGWRERAHVLWGSAANTARYYFATYREPRKLDRPILDTACTRCHMAVTRPGDTHRFHGIRAHLDQTTIRCTDCHRAHAATSEPTQQAADMRQTARRTCGLCHKGDPPSKAVQAVLDAYRQALLQRMKG
ncbi:MAG TPA: hypothetical protein VKB51_03465 [bacterium]|nr:hypothetical protein [bacterium]